MNKVLLILLLLAQTPDQKILREKLANDITKGDTLAWSRHKTGVEQDDEFESVATIPGTGGESEIWVVVNRTIDGTDIRFIEQFQPFDFGDQNDAWFVDSGLKNPEGLTFVPAVPEIPAVPEVPAIPAVPLIPIMTYLSDNGDIWGVPILDGVMGVLLSGPAVDLGGGDVSLTTADNTFSEGQVIFINGSTNYEDEHTLIAGTSATSLRFTDTFNAETFDGTETVVRRIASLPAGAGRMTFDADGNLWYGHNVTAGKVVTRIAPDGTQTTDDINMTFGGSNLGYGVFPSTDGERLYLKFSKNSVGRFNLLTGATDWTDSTLNGGFSAAIDADENVYNGASATTDAWKFTSAGVKTFITGFGSAIAPGSLTQNATTYAMHVDDDMNILVGGGLQSNLVAADPTLLYNLCAKSLDSAGVARLQLGGTFVQGGVVNSTYTIGSGNIQTHDGFIYVLSYTPSPTLYKIAWDSGVPSLTVVNSQVIGTNAEGFYFDLYGNLVVIPATADADRLWFYDTDFSLITKISNLPTAMVTTWGGVGGSWIQGNAAFDFIPAVPEVPAVPGIPAVPETPAHWTGINHLAGIEVCVYADGRPIGEYLVDPNGNMAITEEYDTIIAGINYYSVYESFLLAPKNTTIKSITLDFFETLGAHVGVDQTFSADLKFSYDDFATRQDMVTDWKYATWLRGTTFDPRLYMWHWEPVPLTLRGAYLDMEMTNE